MDYNFLNIESSVEQKLESSPNEIWIKRDDLIHPIISGNKWRKLKYVIKHLRKNNINHLATFGGAFSNHILATACACAKEKIKCSLIIRGEEPKEPNHYLLMARSFGATINFVTREDYKKPHLCTEKLNLDRDDIYVLHEGGAGELGAKGCQEIISELKNTYDYIFVCSGTGTTALGMAQAIESAKLPTKLVVIPILKNENEIEEALKQFSFATVLHNAHAGGYAKTNPSIFKTIESGLKNYGITLDPIYTAKGFRAMKTFLNNHSGTKALFIHTGGMFGLFSQLMLSNWHQAQLGK